MKKVIFTDHAFTRLTRLEFHKNPEKNLGVATKLLSRARKTRIEPGGVVVYERGDFRFVVRENKKDMLVITITKKSPLYHIDRINPTENSRRTASTSSIGKF